MNWRLWLPLLAFAGFLGLAAYMLDKPKTDFVASQMIGEELPWFELPSAIEGGSVMATTDFSDGTPRLLNIWASWCVPCIAEAPQLARLQSEGVEIVGIAVRDRPEDVAQFLSQHGNPYVAVLSDDLSTVPIAVGASGVPETFVVDGTGFIRYQHIGDIRDSDVPVLLEQLQLAGR